MKLFKEFGVDVPYNGYARGGVPIKAGQTVTIKSFELLPPRRKRTKANLQAAVNELGREVLELRRRRDKLLCKIDDLEKKLLVALPGEPGLWTFINQRGKRVTIAAARDTNGQLQVNVVEPA